MTRSHTSTTVMAGLFLVPAIHMAAPWMAGTKEPGHDVPG
jgi:hypothetical protein